MWWGGDVVSYQLRPDSPPYEDPFKEDKPLKYLNPKGAKNRLDCHPSTQHLLADPTVPLWITEGIKKGDALATEGECCVVVTGVWNWRGTDDQGDKGPIPDLEDIQLHGRPVYLAYDSDVMVKASVESARDAFSTYLARRGALVRWVYLPDGARGAKIGVDDYLAEGHDVDDLRSLAVPWSGRTTWYPKDVGAVVRGESLDPPPTIGVRSDGLRLLYAERVNALFSETEAGKTWLALYVCKERLLAGEHVLYVDFEDSPAGVVGRLLDLRVNPAVIEERFHYVRPDEALDDDGAAELFGTVEAYRPTFIVLDGVTEAMMLHGFKINDNDDAASFMKLLTRPLARTGAAVLALDHVVKEPGDRGRYPIGAQHKLSGVDGAAYRLEVVVRFRRGHRGSSRLKVAKDRPGHVRPQTSTYDRIGVFVLDSTDPVGSFAELVPPEAPGTPKADIEVNPEVAEEVSRYLEKAAKPASVTAVKRAIKRRGSGVGHALEWLFEHGYVTRHEEGEGKSKLYAHKAPFRVEEETGV